MSGCSSTHWVYTAHHDNRDFDILPNYQPRDSETFHQQTVLFGQPEGVRHTRGLIYFLLTQLSLAGVALDIPENVHPSLPARKRPR